jgi:hypothetical protein
MKGKSKWYLVSQRAGEGERPVKQNTEGRPGDAC